jgi:O-antigen/teichoic acid export membrane protein
MFGRDIVLNFFASLVIVITLQLFIYPYLSKEFGKNIFGYILSLMGVVNTIALTFGSALDNTRLITYQDYKNIKYHADFNIILKYGSLINVFITTLVIFVLADSINFIDAALLVLVTVLTMLRAYLGVEYRLKINYLSILFYNLSVSVGYVIGAFISSSIGAWQITFLCGELCALVFALFTTDFMKVRGKQQRTGLFKGTLKGFVQIAVSTMIANVLIYLDRFIIYPFMGGENVAIFFAASMFGKVISMVLQPVAGVILTYLAQWKQKMELIDFWKFNFALVVLSGIFYIFSIFLSPIVTGILYPDIMIDAKKILSLANMAAIIAAMGALTQPVLLKFCSTCWQIVLQVIFGVSYFLSGVILLNIYGLPGFCAAALISSVLRLIIMWIVGSCTLKDKALKGNGAFLC